MIVISLTVVTLFVAPRIRNFSLMRETTSTTAPENLQFSDQFPVAEDYQKELKNLLESGELEPTNEKLIREWSTAAARDMGMPPAVLWCLFFQESRLDHLQGYQTKRPAKGLGQFLHPTFFEVNHQLDRFTPVNSQVLIRRLGQDVRPVKAVRKRSTDLSSYYHIPTAVLASAGYLNNRYHQLGKNLRARGIHPDPQLLWLYSVMAYNKGTRSVLSFWNKAYRSGGTARVTALVTDYATFEKAIRNKTTLTRALERVWNKSQSDRYATELRIHLTNVARCAIPPRNSPTTIKNGGVQ